MNRETSHRASAVSAGVFCQRLAGLILVSAAIALAFSDAAGFALSPEAGAILLMATLAIIAFAIYNTPGRATSLIGLFFVGTLLWVAPRPVIALISQDDSVYTLLFGQLVAPRGADLYHLLVFWIVGVAGLFGGYFLFFSNARISLPTLSRQGRTYCKRSFMAALVIVAVLLPVLAQQRAAAFASGGYTALYMNQAESSFSILPILGYLTPTLYALAVIVGEKKYTRLMIVAVVGYALCGIYFGRRMEAGTWLLVALWHSSAIREKTIRTGPLLAGFAAAAVGFQWVEVLRTQSDLADQILFLFFSSQVVLFMIPALSFQLPVPPLHTTIGSLLSMRHVYSLLGIGTVGTANILDYISSQSSPDLFAGGNGLSSTGFLDVFYLCGRVMILYAIGCAVVGFLLRKWEARALRSNVAMFLLCISLPSLFFVQRSSVFTVTSPAVFLSVFMAGTYVLNLLITIVKSGARRLDAPAPGGDSPTIPNYPEAISRRSGGFLRLFGARATGCDGKEAASCPTRCFQSSQL